MLQPFRRLGVPRSKMAAVCLKPVRPAAVRSAGIRISRDLAFSPNRRVASPCSDFCRSGVKPGT